MKLTLVALIFAITMSTFYAFGGPVAQRQRNQEARVRNGVRSGELTRREAIRLDRNAVRINRTIRRDRADGNGLTSRERLKINRMLGAQSRAIQRQKRDLQ